MKKEILKNAFIGEEAVKLTHESGLTVFVIKKDFTTAYAMFGTRYGSFDNEFTLDGERISVPHGIAHFLEHKMFETEDGEDTFEQFAEIGADANAYTSTDRTAYLFSCTEEFYEALRILINMVMTPVFTKENVQKEQGIIAEEIKMCEDRPGNALHYNLMRAMYEKNPVRIPIAGTVQSISEITPELLYKCYGAFYRMNNMAICICGDVDADKVAEIVDEMIPKGRASEVIFDTVSDVSDVYRKLIETEAEIAKPLFSIGIKHPEGCSDTAAACEILSEALFGECEDLFSDLYEGELVSRFRAYYEYGRASCHFGITGDSFEPEKVYEKVLDYVKGVREKGVSRDAFERAKRNAYADSLRAFELSEDIAEGLFDAFLVGENYLDSAEGYQAVTYEQVNTLAKSVLTENRFCMSVVYPCGYERKGK